MMRSAVAAYLLLGVACSAGCSSLDCCRWWHRNSDGSNNYDRPKPVPVQAGPIAGTYQQPTTGTVIQPSGMNTPLMNTNTPPSPPVVVTSPAQAAPPPSNSPTPPAMNVAPPGVFPQQPPNAPPTLMGPTSNSSPLSNQQGTGIVQNTPSITSPIMPEMAVKGPSIDLTVAGASGPAPMLMAPTVGNQAVEKSLAQLSGPTIPMPQTSMPQMATPPTIPIPPIAGTAAPQSPRTVSLNPGTVPPPLAPAPQVPQFENR